MGHRGMATLDHLGHLVERSRWWRSLDDGALSKRIRERTANTVNINLADQDENLYRKNVRTDQDGAPLASIWRPAISAQAAAHIVTVTN